MGDTLTFTLDQLHDILVDQKRATADYITRNLSVYSFYNNPDVKIADVDKVKEEIRQQCYKSPFPEDYNILSKYIKK